MRNSSVMILLCLWIGQAWGLSSDREQPINIVANRAQVDNIRGIAIYEGDVIVTQGTIKITAQKLTLHFVNEQDIERVVAEGEPSTFKQTPDNKKGDINAKAMEMEYLANEDMLHLRKKAQLWQGKDYFSGEAISYNTQRGIIKARDRISVQIMPKKKKENQKEDQE